MYSDTDAEKICGVARLYEKLYKSNQYSNHLEDLDEVIEMAVSYFQSHAESEDIMLLAKKLLEIDNELEAK
jgi:hypothetical protein